MLDEIQQAIDNGTAEKNALIMELIPNWNKKFADNDTIPCPMSLWTLKLVHTMATGKFNRMTGDSHAI